MCKITNLTASFYIARCIDIHVFISGGVQMLRFLWKWPNAGNRQHWLVLILIHSNWIKESKQAETKVLGNFTQKRADRKAENRMVNWGLLGQTSLQIDLLLHVMKCNKLNINDCNVEGKLHDFKIPKPNLTSELLTPQFPWILWWNFDIFQYKKTIFRVFSF